MAGLLQQDLNKDDPLKTVSGVEAVTSQMGKGESSADRVADVISKDSELMQIAGTRGKQTAGSRGLLNSNLAAESSMAAVIERASPLAMQDASTSSTFKLANQAATNDANKFTAGEKNASARMLEQGNQQLRSIKESGVVESGLIKERGEIDKQLQTADAASRAALLERQGAIDTELQTLRGRQETEAASQRGTIDAILLQERGRIDAALQTADAASRASLLERQGKIDADLQTADAASRASLLERQGKIDADLQASRDRQELIMQNLRGEQANDLADIQGKYETLAATSQTAGIAMQNHSIALAEILGNENIPANQKQDLVDKQLGLMRTQLEVIGSLGGINLADQLKWGTTSTTTSTTGNTGIPATEEPIGDPNEYYK